MLILVSGCNSEFMCAKPGSLPTSKAISENGQNCIEKHFGFFGAFEKFRKATITFVMYVCVSVRLTAWNNSAPIRWIFMKSDI